MPQLGCHRVFIGEKLLAHYARKHAYIHTNRYYIYWNIIMETGESKVFNNNLSAYFMIYLDNKSMAQCQF